jgi:hypothetical protein
MVGEHRGQYIVEKGLITVTFLAPDGSSRSKTTQLGGSAQFPEGLASIMLSEILTAWKKKAE